MNEHPSADIVGSESRTLDGKVVVLAITGSVGCVRSSDLARKLIRNGARVVPVMSRAACELVHPNLLHWATGVKPILELTGDIEHVAWVGNVPVRADLLLVAPATANSIGKFACGIDDTPVTTFFTTAFGEGVPIVVVPAMHQSMYDHPIVRENLEKLERLGVDVLMPRVEEGKAKIADEKKIYEAVVAKLDAVSRPRPLAGKSFVVTAGRTVEYLDPIRVVTNNSSGKMGIAIAEAAARLGASVTLVAGKLSVPLPRGIAVVHAPTSQQMFDACRELVEEGKPNAFVAAAAVGDWKPVRTESEKIPTSGGKITVELVPTPKIVDAVKTWSPSTFLVAFRAQSSLSDEELERDASERRLKAGANLIAANDVAREGEGFEGETNRLVLLDDKGRKEVLSLDSKVRIAEKLLVKICEML